MSTENPDEDFDAVDYARSHGLCVDYTSDEIGIDNIGVPSDDTFRQDLNCPSNETISNDISILLKERLTVSKDAAFLLGDVLSVPDAPIFDLSTVQRPKRTTDLKQELPILHTDDEVDLLEFGSADLLDLKDLRIPSEVTNEDNDEGLSWPAKYFTYPTMIEKEMKSERLVVPKEALIYLQNAIRDDFTTKDAERIEVESLTCRVWSL